MGYNESLQISYNWEIKSFICLLLNNETVYQLFRFCGFSGESLKS